MSRNKIKIVMEWYFKKIHDKDYFFGDIDWIRTVNLAYDFYWQVSRDNSNKISEEEMEHLAWLVEDSLEKIMILYKDEDRYAIIKNLFYTLGIMLEVKYARSIESLTEIEDEEGE